MRPGWGAEGRSQAHLADHGARNPSFAVIAHSSDRAGLRRGLGVPADRGALIVDFVLTIHPALVAVMLAFAVAMALATVVEAASTRIAQLWQLDDHGLKRFGHHALLATLVIVGAVNLGFTFLRHMARCRVSAIRIYPIRGDSTGLAGSLVIAAAPGLLKALVREEIGDDKANGILSAWVGPTNRYYTPFWSVLVYAVLAAAVISAGRANELELILLYAVSVFLSFLAGAQRHGRVTVPGG